MNGIAQGVLENFAASIDLSFIIRRLEGEGRTSEEAEQAVTDYRRFLSVLADDPTLPLVPTKKADQAWHEHILFMEKYEHDMLKLVGGRVYHCPDVPDHLVWEQGVANTRTGFRDKFGVELTADAFAPCFVTTKPA